jgi:hypothetical protein
MTLQNGGGYKSFSIQVLGTTAPRMSFHTRACALVALVTLTVAITAADAKPSKNMTGALPTSNRCQGHESVLLPIVPTILHSSAGLVLLGCCAAVPALSRHPAMGRHPEA